MKKEEGLREGTVPAVSKRKLITEAAPPQQGLVLQAKILPGAQQRPAPVPVRGCLWLAQRREAGVWLGLQACAFLSWTGKPRSTKQLPQALLTETSAAYGQEACVLCQAGDTGMWRGQEISFSGKSKDLSIWNSSTLKWGGEGEE